MTRSDFNDSDKRAAAEAMSRTLIRPVGSHVGSQIGAGSVKDDDEGRLT